MAKISARGAVKICSVTAMSPADYSYLLTMCSDGRVLIRPSDGTESYRVLMKSIKVQYRNMDGLRRLCKVKGFTITHEANGANGRMVPLTGQVFGDDFCTVGDEKFQKDGDEDLYYLSVRRNASYSYAITCLTKAQLKAIRDVIDGFLEEGM